MCPSTALRAEPRSTRSLTPMGIRLIMIGGLLFVACATPYQRHGFTGGFSESQLDENVFRVNFRGNGYTSPERAADFTLLRSAELARAHEDGAACGPDLPKCSSGAVCRTSSTSSVGHCVKISY